MKIKSDIHAGNILDDAYTFASEVLSGIPQFVNSIDDKARNFYEQAVDSAQGLWDKFTGLF